MNNIFKIFLCLILILKSGINSNAASMITEVTYFSKTMNSNRKMNVYLPDGYNQNSWYPTFYLMHGGGQRYYTWANPVDGNAKAILDQAISTGKALPMIVVMPDVPDFAPSLFTKELCNDVIPYIEKNYRAKPEKDSRALAGLSWGGLQVLDAGLYRYELFGYMGVFSSGWFIGDNVYNVMRTYLAANGSEIEASMRYLYYGQGGTGDIAYNNGAETMKLLRANGITVNYWEHTGAHSFVCWRQDLQAILPFLFSYGLTPEVTITAPATNASFTAPAAINFTATANDPSGTISKVEFFNGTTRLGEDASAPFTFSWTNVPAGTYTIKAVATNNAGTKATSGAVTVRVNVPQGPFKGTPWAIPGLIEAEHYDIGGEGSAFHEANADGNEGLATLRNDEVDVETTGDASGFYNVGYILKGEWLEYTVNVTSEGKYDLNLRVAADGTGRTFHVEMDNKDITGDITVPNTGGWQKWETVTVPGIDLTAGQKLMRIVFDSDYMNLNWMEFEKATITGIDNFHNENTAVYPNPFTDKIYCNTTGEYNYQLLNIEGQVLEDGFAKGEIHIQKNYPKGTYILKIHQNDQVRVFKIFRD
jgi:enterochelin esterase-like enzyme